MKAIAEFMVNGILVVTLTFTACFIVAIIEEEVKQYRLLGKEQYWNTWRHK